MGLFGFLKEIFGLGGSDTSQPSLLERDFYYSDADRRLDDEHSPEFEMQFMGENFYDHDDYDTYDERYNHDHQQNYYDDYEEDDYYDNYYSNNNSSDDYYNSFYGDDL